MMTKPYKRFWKLLQNDKKEIRNIYVYAIFIGFINLSLPLGIQAIINLIQGGYFSTSWIMLVIFVVLGVAFAGIMQIYQLRITENLQQKIFTRAAFEFAYRIPRLKVEILFKKYLPELTNRFFDILSVQKGLSKVLLDFSTAGLQLFFGLLLLSFYHPFFIVFSIVMLVLVILLFLLNAKVGLQTSLEESKNKYKLVYWLEDLAANFIPFKLSGKTNLPTEKTNDHSEAYLKSREGHFKILVRLYSFLVVFKVLVTTGLLLLGGVLVIEQQMNIGQFVAAEIIIIMVMNSVEKMTLSLDTIFDVLTALEKIAELTDEEIEDDNEIEDDILFSSHGVSIEIDKLNFKFPGRITNVLSDIAFKIDSNEKIMIAGDESSGKSILLQYLSGIYESQGERFSINGIPKENWKKETLRGYIGIHLNDQQFFNGSVLENITLGRDRASYNNVKWSLENVGLNELIKHLPEGYNTMLLPKNNNLSNSHKQKLLLARAIVTKPSFLLIEDNFDCLGLEEKKKIIKFLTDKKQPWTLVVVSDDKKWAMASDRIIIMENGYIQQINNYDSLDPSVKFKDYNYA